MSEIKLLPSFAGTTFPSRVTLHVFVYVYFVFCLFVGIATPKFQCHLEAGNIWANKNTCLQSKARTLSMGLYAQAETVPVITKAITNAVTRHPKASKWERKYRGQIRCWSTKLEKHASK